MSTRFVFWIEKTKGGVAEPVIMGDCVSKNVQYFIRDEDITFRKVKDSKADKMGEPIDVSSEDGAEKLLKALEENDEAYMTNLFCFSCSVYSHHFQE